MKPDSQHFESLTAMIMATKPEEIDCDEWLDRVARYAELVQRGGSIPSDLKLVAQHVTVCPECSEELDALLALLDSPS